MRRVQWIVFCRRYNIAMSFTTLAPENHARLRADLTDTTWCVACLCAAWCDVCGNFRDSYAALAAQHPQIQFVWIDIEDEANLVGDIDVDNFPTLLIQRGSQVAFFGTVEPDAKAIGRLLQSQMRHVNATDADASPALIALPSSATATKSNHGLDLRARLDAHLNP